jgi:hypothetical protein
MNFFILIDPRRVNVKMLTWIVGIIAAIVMWSIFVDEGEKDDLMKSKGLAEVAIDRETKLPILDLSNSNQLGQQSFHAAIQGKEFLVSGVETTILFSKTNPKTIFPKEDYLVVHYSDILSKTCLDDLAKKMSQSKLETLDVEEIVKSTCGENVYSIDSKIPANNIQTQDDVKKLCSSEINCASCLVMSGIDKPIGQCDVKKYLFNDDSKALTNSGSMWISIGYQPVNQLSFMRYPPQLRYKSAK